MAISLKHTTVATGTNANNGEIAKEEWNEEHALTLATARLLGRSTSGTGAAEEIAAGAGLALSSGSLVLNGPAFRATGNGLTTVPHVDTKCAFGTETFDTNANYDSATNYRFTPTVAGYYAIGANVYCEVVGSEEIESLTISLSKNGTQVSVSQVHNVYVSSVLGQFAWLGLQVSDCFAANGSTDYFECTVTALTTGDVNATYGGTFSGYFVRGS